MISRQLDVALAALLIAGTASAQAYNLDIQGGVGMTPPSTFGAFTDQTGVWDGIAITAAPTTMVDINGGQPGPTYRFTNVANTTIEELVVGDYGTAPSAEVRDLYDDHAVASPNNSNVQVHFEGLLPGKYRFYVYAWTPSRMTPLRFTVGTTNLSGNMNHGFPFPTPPDFIQGRTFQARTLTVGVGQTVTIRTNCNDSHGGGGQMFAKESASDDCTIAGIQIVPVNGIQGCTQAVANSIGGFPRINAYGTTNAAGAFDSSINGGVGDIVLSAGSLPGGLPPGRLILTFASNSAGGPSPQIQPSCGGVGDPNITRCLAPTGLIRVNTPTVLSNPSGVFTTPLNLLDLANQGLNVSPGAQLHFQMIYQDAPVAADLCQIDPILRWTRSLRIDLF